MANLSITVRNVGAAEEAKTQALIALLPERKTLPKSLKALDVALGGTMPPRSSWAISPVQQGLTGGCRARVIFSVFS